MTAVDVNAARAAGIPEIWRVAARARAERPVRPGQPDQLDARRRSLLVTLGGVEREALLSGLVHPGGRAPAPGGLALVQGLVNTVDREHGPDLLDDVAGFQEWLNRRGLLEPDARVTVRDLAAARELREALRGLLLANNGEPEPPWARRGVEAAAARAELRAAFPPDGAELVPQRDGVDGALGRVVAAAFAAMLDGGWSRLKACPRDRCGWAFYDRSSNASATWCSMSVCGGRVKSGAYYRRRRRAAGG
jgi:predicted RNA-binding Zn ribbon-like protein